VAIVLLALDRQGILEPITEPANRVLAPVTRTFTRIRLSVGETVDNIFGDPAASRETAALQEQITQLQNENLALRSAAAENATLRRTAGMRERYGWQTTIANVVGRSPDNSTRMLTIDRGRVDGLAVGMPVISHINGSPDALIGLIDTLGDSTASVLLITDARSVISGQILHRNAQTGEVTQPKWRDLGPMAAGIAPAYASDRTRCAG
jgi:rod shape-determining protein MreC